MASSVLLPSEIDLTRIVYLPIREYPGGKSQARFIPVKYKNETDEECDLLISIPKMRLAFNGLSVHDNPDGTKKYSISVSYEKSNAAYSEKLNSIAQLQDLFSKIDDMNIDHAFENCEQMFSKTKSKEVLQDNYTSIIKHSDKLNEQTGKPWAPTTKVKLPIRRNRAPLFDIYDKEQQLINIYNAEADEVDFSSIEKGAEVCAIVRLSSLWVSKMGFGATLEIRQLQVFPQHKVLRGFAIRSQESESEEEEEEVFSDADEASSTEEDS